MFLRILPKALLIVGTIALVFFCAVTFFNPRLTRYVESDRFRSALEKETAKGLHYPSGHYAPIRRTGFLTATSDGFQADHGRKALRTLDAHGIRATFNPWGIFLQRWQLDQVHIDSGEVQVQTYAPEPEPSPGKPWFRVFLPERVYLKQVESDPADVTWQFRGQKGGFFGTRLLITPHGRDFNYQAIGGTFKMALFPDLQLRDTHLLITKTWLTLYNLDLESKVDAAGKIHAEGTAGTGKDRSVDFKIKFEAVPVEEWLPANWHDHVAGVAFADIVWRGENPKLESSAGEGSVRIEGGRLFDLPFLEKVATITGQKSLQRLQFNNCSGQFWWNYPKEQIKNIVLEDKGKLRIEGEITVHQKSLGGTLQLGVPRPYLAWLPKAEEIFIREDKGYLWTAVHLSGTIDAPQQDLSPRIAEVIKESPAAALRLLFRQIRDWLEHDAGGK
jgi:hypothetical protein